MYRKISANHLAPDAHYTVSEGFADILAAYKPPGRVLSLHKEKHKNRIVYRTLLDITGDCNEKWAHMHGHQYRAITGIYLDDELESICHSQTFKQPLHSMASPCLSTQRVPIYSSDPFDRARYK